MPIPVTHLLPKFQFIPHLGLQPVMIMVYSMLLARWLLKIKFDVKPPLFSGVKLAILNPQGEEAQGERAIVRR